MIKTFKDKRTAALFAGVLVKGVPADVAQRSRNKMELLDSTSSLEFLRSPPANRLERLKGNRDGQHSIRVNDQWRLCFVWRNGDVFDVELCDYH